MNVPDAATSPSVVGGAASQAGRAIAVAGEALVDFVLEPGGGTTPHLGGCSFNAARTLGWLGLPPVFIGRLSRDRYGRALRSALEESGVILEGVVATDAPTTFARVDGDGHGATGCRSCMEGTSMAGLLPEEARAAMPARVMALHVGGLGTAVEPQASAIVTLVREAGTETLVLVDPNCRAGVTRARSVFCDRLRDLMCLADVVKASEEDFAYLDPDRTPDQTARALAWLGGWVTDGRGRRDLGNFDAVLRTAEFAALVAARTCGRAGAEPCEDGRRPSGGGASARREGGCGVALRRVNASRGGRRRC